jgi:hypothetical protein
MQTRDNDAHSAPAIRLLVEQPQLGRSGRELEEAERGPVATGVFLSRMVAAPVRTGGRRVHKRVLAQHRVGRVRRAQSTCAGWNITIR